MERGDFEIIVPPEELRPFVRRYLYANRTLDADITFRGKPTGYPYFCNFFGKRSYGVIDGRRFEPKTRCFLFGQILQHDVTFHHALSIQILVCELTPTAHNRLFGIPGDKILGFASSFEEAAPHCLDLARECFVAGAEATRDEHVAEGNAFFAKLAERAAPEDVAVERAIALIEGAHGAVRVADLCREIGVGERQLNRKFKHVVGLSPKYFARILQMNWVVSLLYANDAVALSRIALEAGFYDQAHFNRAMQRFFKEGPREFLRSEHPAFRSFLAESRRYGPASPDGEI